MKIRYEVLDLFHCLRRAAFDRRSLKPRMRLQRAMSCCVYMFQGIYVKRGSMLVMASRDTASSHSLLLCILSSRSLRKIFIYIRHVDAKEMRIHYATPPLHRSLLFVARQQTTSTSASLI